MINTEAKKVTLSPLLRTKMPASLISSSSPLKDGVLFSVVAVISVSLACFDIEAVIVVQFSMLFGRVRKLRKSDY